MADGGVEHGGDAEMRVSAGEILAIEPVGEDRFIGGAGGVNHIGTVFGGRLAAQALLSAARTVEAMPPTSLHGYFLAPAQISLPIEYRVERLRDSRRFAHRQVTAVQEGRAVFTLLCQFHAPEDGFVHQAAAMPDVPPPEEVPTLQQFVRDNGDRLDFAAIRNFSGALPIEMRAIAPEAYFYERPREPERAFWFRLPGAATIDDPREQACLLAYASDYWLAGVSATPHGFPTNSSSLLISSLDHSLWFHRPVRCDEWLLHHTHSPAAGDGLGFAQGRIFDRRGRLVASTAQECLLRQLRPDA
ncbi:acyl-CoA thioesterase II [Sphingomonas histidinilytica]|jgi:acyl-CoA thioesterase-2|uniref:acyl-CoA thioesterase n=1 Tax=Rhizorhabdus histidinilytica TaxID=439228 RepID=UPI000F787132|nr:acyl-CoA thioesterase domain-containing protein [Rhizorhabdus histidinilytica]MBO9376165.1 acyl-CoA thioesterase II [Rhizorhabdus histidinilytica]QEH78277.1 acyl-CoA thioesterase II [Sphingomonas sp. C8-2]